jgi:hypothetical protein
MVPQNSKNEIVESLIKYIPEISKSLSKLVDILKSISESNHPRNEAMLRDVLNELGNLLPHLSSIQKEMSPKIQNNAGDELLILYLNCMGNIIYGLENMLKWSRDEKESDETLKKSIDSLYIGSQDVIKLVNAITS